MATVSHDPLALNWELPAGLVPLELVDPLADDDSPGLDDLPAPSEPRVPFAQWLADQASYYRSLGTEAGAFVAELIQGTAEMARSLKAASPAEYEARLE